jgi:glycosyltransferase involved in cell wall biosynthesis
VVVPAWRQARYLAAAVRSALDQEIEAGVGVVVVNDGCPDPETDRIGQALRDADPKRVAYLRQPNGGLSAARNAGIRRALARWPAVEAVFPLDADNLLSPHTLAALSARLREHPEAAWAYPALEFFGAEEGGWQVPGPFLPYRQLFTNQCDAGSLVCRAVFDAGIEFDETMREGFEDWEFFLRATLAGYRGVQAGRCGFRYRRRPGSMVAAALSREEELEAEIRRRHSGAYEEAALSHREHAEAPRYALVRCDAGDVLLTADPALPPRQLGLAEFARRIAAAGAPEPAVDPVPAVTVLTGSATIERLQAEGRLAEALDELRSALRSRAAVGLRLAGDEGAAAGPAALAVRAGALSHLRDGLEAEAEIAVELSASTGGLQQVGPPPAELAAARRLIGAAADSGAPLPLLSHSSFFERLHIDEGEPLAAGGARVAA